MRGGVCLPTAELWGTPRGHEEVDAKDYETAKKHADVAKERAECGYKPALDKAIKLSKLIAEKSKS